ncbi:MAG: glycosyl hydrolase-related protein [candidate division KSB1 bacterium]|nr:glycosyl hydrolase-related protein [candidate division KSB1 bacterium]MDZ7334247.1 glycosyl hydrolase-related protein [candidate division KSB1 bacterium]MDZ7356355.1 glycosyl hydrolase-related protein [candidate division KSB1 bacterium]MDZ7375446.1 glycosyl hydrolase-related protein [candidate division KSB1 bacterium]MDZ7401047.1 glycosyl hydrolase-related protein [candidate division KSB1 bacterium]
MKKMFLAVAIGIIWAVQLLAQTSSSKYIDMLCAELERYMAIRFDEWKYTTQMAIDAWRPNYDDVGWKTIRIDESIYPDSAWLRKTIFVPERILGMPVLGGTIRLVVSVDDAGICWINGEKKGLFKWTGEYLLTRDAKPGQAFSVAIKAINTGGPMRLLEARLVWDRAKPLADKVQDYILSLRVGQKLLSGDTYLKTGRVQLDRGIDLSTVPTKQRTQLRKQLEEAARLVEVTALKNGYPQIFEASLEKSRQALRPIGKFAKEFTLIFDSNAHIDCAWLWRYLETINVAKNTFSSVLDMMEARPDFTYTQSQAHLYWWMETLHPNVFQRIQQRVADGRWEIVGGMWVEPDCNLISGESWARQLLYGKRYFREKFGVDVKIGWNPDSFGYNWNMPQFYRDAGITAFITQKIGWNDTNMFPYRLFWWQAPDGTKILTYFPNDYVNEIKNPFALVDWLRQFEANTGLKNMLVLYGVGDHGGGPDLEMINRIEALKKLDIYPTVRYGTASEYLDWIRSQDLSNLPVWTDELYLEYHRGTYTTQSNTKRHHRESEQLFGNAEQIAAIAGLYGHPYHRTDMLAGWRGVLFNQFHDILPGSSIYAVYKDADELYQQSQQIAKHELETSLKFLATLINTKTKKNVTPVLIYNPLAWTRTDIVELLLPEDDHQIYSLFNSQGKAIPSQIVSAGRYRNKILFIAEDIPAMGYAVYELRSQPPNQWQHLSATDLSAENEFYRLSIDSTTGWLSSIYDKRLERELLSGPGNELQLIKDTPSAWDAWNLGLGERYPSNFRGARLIEEGPVRSVIRVQHDFLKPGVEKSYPTPNNPNSYFTQDIILYRGIDRIDFVTEADWWEEHVMLKVAFAVAASDSLASYEIPFGTIRRPTTMRNDWEKARFEVNQHHWFDLTDATQQFGVSLLNRAKYGGDIHGQVMRLSLLRSPKWPDPMADMGKHRIEYSLYPHSGDWKTGNSIRRGYEYNYPLLARIISSQKGKLPKVHSFISVAPENVLLATIKIAEPEKSFDFDAQADPHIWIVRLYETHGEAAETVVRFPRPVKRACKSNFLEEEGEPLTFEANQVKFNLNAHQIITIKVWLE